MELEWHDIFRLLAAIGAGALIGVEREVRGKPAGLRTNILICLGAALFTLLSVRVAEAGGVADRGRIAAQIVTGVGFLGAGAILQHRNHVAGLTTAATIWAVASLGMAFGAGEFELGGLGTLLIGCVLIGLGLAEAGLSRWRTVGRFEVRLDPEVGTADVIDPLVKRARVKRKTWTVNKTPEGIVIRFKAVGPVARLRGLQRAMVEEKSIQTLKRL